MKKIFGQKSVKKHPPEPPFNFKKTGKIGKKKKVLRKLLLLRQFLVHVDDMGIKLFRKASTFYIMNSFLPRGGQNWVKIGQNTEFRYIFPIFSN